MIKKSKTGRKNKKDENTKDKSKEEKKKEKKKKERKILKKIGLDSKPPKEIINKLDCVDSAIDFGLEKCGERIFENLDLP